MLHMLPLALVGASLVLMSQRLSRRRAPALNETLEPPTETLEDLREELDLPMVLFVGRSGAGKTSVINALLGQQLLETGDVASTTRAVQGAAFGPLDSAVALVDTPGIGEVGTSECYAQGLIEWFSANAEKVLCIALVIQADAKAHAEDLRFVTQMRAAKPSCPTFIVLNQVDKLPPLRGIEMGSDWSEERALSSAKAAHIREKLRLVERQFELGPGGVIPSVARPGALFNMTSVAEAIEVFEQGDGGP